jgi:hypothetical protein
VNGFSRLTSDIPAMVPACSDGTKARQIPAPRLLLNGGRGDTS